MLKRSLRVTLLVFVLVCAALVGCSRTNIPVADTQAGRTGDRNTGRDASRTDSSAVPGAHDKRQLWSLKLGEMLRRDMVVAPDGTIYVSDIYGNRLCAVTPTGQIKWTYRVGEMVDAAPAIGPDGTVYVGCWDFKLYALTPDGHLKWTYKTGDSISCAPTVGMDGTVYVVSNNGDSDDLHGRLYALSPNGNLKWSFNARGSDCSDPVVDSSDTVYVGDDEGQMYAVAPGGRLKWSYRTGNMAMSPAIDASGTVYFGSQDYRFYAIAPDGKLKWSKDLGDNFVYSRPLVGSDGTVYAAVMGKGLYAFAPGGTTKWTYPIADLSTSSPTFGPDGTIYIGSGQMLIGGSPPPGPQGHLYALRPQGTLKWSSPVPGIVECRPAVDASGTVYIADGHGNLFAFRM